MREGIAGALPEQRDRHPRARAEPKGSPRGSHAADMSDMLAFLAMIAVWFVVQYVLLPRMGVPT